MAFYDIISLVKEMNTNRLVRQILDFIDINIDSNITIKVLEDKFYYNRYYIMKTFKRKLNVTIFDYINRLRIYHSIQDINESNKSMMRIALENGFNSLEYFSEIFKKVMGVAPTNYKKIIKHIVSSDEEYYMVLNNYIKLKALMDQVEKYKNSTEEKTTIKQIKKLTIFRS